MRAAFSVAFGVVHSSTAVQVLLARSQHSVKHEFLRLNISKHAQEVIRNSLWAQ